MNQDQTLKGVEQYITDITTGKKYWAVVIDVGTSKPSSTSYTGTGTVLVAKELGTTSSSTTGWVGTKDGVDIPLKKDHWYIIGVAIDSSASNEPAFDSLKCVGQKPAELKTILEYDTVTGSWKTLDKINKIEKYKAYFIDAVC